jgi:hypothetical protein
MTKSYAVAKGRKWQLWEVVVDADSDHDATPETVRAEIERCLQSSAKGWRFKVNRAARRERELAPSSPRERKAG